MNLAAQLFLTSLITIASITLFFIVIHAMINKPGEEKMNVDMVTKLWMGGIILFGVVLYCAAYWVAQQSNR